MGDFFKELAKKLAERWLTLLLIPGALFLVVLGFATRLGHPHAFDYSRLRMAATDFENYIGKSSAGVQIGALIAALLGAAGVGLAVQGLASVTRMVWVGPWPRLVGPLQRRRIAARRRRWMSLVERRRALQQSYPLASRTSDQQHEIDFAAQRVNQLALAEPGRPTWMGDRIHALTQVALNRYGLDLTFAWPRLWLVFPDTARAEVTNANAAFAAAVATGTWGWPYLILGGLWWPAAIVGTGIGATGWYRARAAIADLNAVSEAALDLYGRDLATALGVAEPGRAGPLTVTEGQQVSTLLRKGR